MARYETVISLPLADEFAYLLRCPLARGETTPQQVTVYFFCSWSGRWRKVVVGQSAAQGSQNPALLAHMLVVTI